jgi:hypothetical protein
MGICLFEIMFVSFINNYKETRIENVSNTN